MDQLRLGGPKALAATKSLIYRVPNMSRQEAFEWTQEMSQQLFQSEEAMQGIQAFIQRQKPPWAKL